MQPRVGGCVYVCVVVCVVCVGLVGFSSCEVVGSSYSEDGVYVSGWRFPKFNLKGAGEGVRGNVKTVEVLSGGSEVVGGSLGDENLSFLMSDEEMEKYKRQVDIVTEYEWNVLQEDVNVFWLLAEGILVFMLQLAFPMLEVGMFSFVLNHSPCHPSHTLNHTHTVHTSGCDKTTFLFFSFKSPST